MTSFPNARTLAELRFATRVLLRRYRTLPPSRHEPIHQQPAFVPEWIKRGKLARVLDHGAAGR